MDAELREGNPHFAADYRQARITVGFIQKGDTIPFISASYEVHTCHPDQVFQRITQMRQAKLGREFPLWFDKNGVLRPNVAIADYDPTCGLAPVLPCQAGPGVGEPITLPPRKWPKAPARLVMSRTRIVIHDDVFFCEEVLECGHTHFDYIGGWIGGNPKKRRRRCRECQNAIAAEKKPLVVSPEEVAKIRIMFA
jgi:hypothetical protein